MRQLELRGLRPKTIKKEFETTWSESALIVLDKLSFVQQQFFQTISGDEKISVRNMIHPDAIPYQEMQIFNGRKTRITIEVIE